mgnify:FL=1
MVGVLGNANLISNEHQNDQALIIRSLDRNLPKVMGDPSQVDQIILNLVINAAEALPDEGGAIRIKTSSANIDARANPNFIGQKM